MIWTMTVLLPLSALGAEGVCPAGSASLFRCEVNRQYTALCAAPGPDRPTSLRLVAGKVGRPPSVVVPPDGALSAFSWRVEGEEQDEGSRHLRVSDGTRTWHLVSAWWNGGYLPRSAGTVTTERGGVWESRCGDAVEDRLASLDRVLQGDPGLPPAPAPPRVQGHCGAGMTELLTCGIGTDVLSICGAPAGTPTGLQYRFGPPGAPELVYPATPSLAAFRTEVSVSGNGANVYGALSFDREGYTYEVESSMPDTGNGDPEWAAVSVHKGGARVSRLQCTHGIAVRLPGVLRDLRDAR